MRPGRAGRPTRGDRAGRGLARREDDRHGRKVRARGPRLHQPGKARRGRAAHLREQRSRSGVRESGRRRRGTAPRLRDHLCRGEWQAGIDEAPGPRSGAEGRDPSRSSRNAHGGGDPARGHRLRRARQAGRGAHLHLARGEHARGRGRRERRFALEAPRGGDAGLRPDRRHRGFGPGHRPQEGGVDRDHAEESRGPGGQDSEAHGHRPRRWRRPHRAPGGVEQRRPGGRNHRRKRRALRGPARRDGGFGVLGRNDGHRAGEGPAEAGPQGRGRPGLRRARRRRDAPVHRAALRRGWRGAFRPPAPLGDLRDRSPRRPLCTDRGHRGRNRPSASAPADRWQAHGHGRRGCGIRRGGIPHRPADAGRIGWSAPHLRARGRSRLVLGAKRGRRDRALRPVQ